MLCGVFLNQMKLAVARKRNPRIDLAGMVRSYVMYSVPPVEGAGHVRDNFFCFDFF
jgi:hypothetical protein